MERSCSREVLETTPPISPTLQISLPRRSAWGNSGGAANPNTNTPALVPGGSLALGGVRFRGIAEGSSGTALDSPGDYPVVQLRSLEGGQTRFIQPTNWSATNFVSAGLTGFPAGWTAATVFVNGINSPSVIFNLGVAVPTPIHLTGATRLPGGAFQCGFTNTTGALFTTLASTNLTLPRSNWTAIGGVTEVSSGHFQVNDPQAAIFSRRFYRVESY